jgi:DnaJ-class molecular chaperone
MEDFYQILGVNENASQDEIKKAYRKLAVEHHPDKGGDENKFKKISEAYDTIGDENKRTQYNNQRRNPFANMGGGGFNPFEDMFNQMHTQRKRAVPDKVIEVIIGALESYNGSDKTINYVRESKCGGCNGNGGERINCTTCNGEGFILQRIGTGLFVQVMRQTCGSCGGNGFTYKTTCGTCHGKTTIKTNETVSVKLPHGVDDGQFLRLQDKGDYKDGMYGNLVLRIKVREENNFDKSGDDLIYSAYFNLNELSKDTLDILHPQGNLSIKLPKTFDTSKPLRVKSKGYHNRGDLFIKLFVKFDRS